MSAEQASAFLESWIVNNVRPVVHPGSDREAEELARHCVRAAEEQGISKADLEACGQGLVTCMCDAQAAVADASKSKMMDEN